MYSRRAIESHLSLSDLYRLFQYKKNFNKKHPQYFHPDGLIVYTGWQGSGKTLSAVRYVCNLMRLYPCCKLVTNISISEYPVDNERVFHFKDSRDLAKYENGELGTIFLIDEIQLYFSSLQSKNIDPQVLVEISQQRKQRKHIVCTSQVFGRLAKPLREQFNCVVLCRNYLGGIQYNKYLRQENIKTDDDYMHLQGRADKVDIFIHSVRDYSNYDTYAKVSDISKNDVKGGQDIYDRNIVTSNN